MADDERVRGKVVTVSRRGFGFIRRSDTFAEVFFHFSSLSQGYQPRVGDILSFEVVPGAKGPQAASVRKIKDAPRTLGRWRPESETRTAGRGR